MTDSEENYRALVDMAADAILQGDTNGGIIRWNPSAEVMTGYCGEELRGMNISKLFSAQTLDSTPLRYDLLLQGKTVCSQRMLRRKDGSELPIEMKSRRMPNGTYQTYISDITDRRSAQKRLTESENRYRAIVNAFDGLIYICSSDFHIEFMNDRLIERTGRNAVGEMCYQVLHDRSDPCPWCVNSRILKGETVRWEVQSPKDGKWYYVVNTPIHHTDGTISKQAMILDITERKRAEEALRVSLQEKEALNQKLRASEEYLRQILDQAPLSMAIVATNGTVEFINRKCTETFGYTRADIPDLDHFWKPVIPDEAYRAEVQTIWNNRVETAKRLHAPIEGHEYQVVCKDGSTKMVIVLGVVIRDAIFILIEDITERRSLERRLRQSEKMNAIGQLAGGMAHDFNNQLSGILGNAELLANRLEDPVLSRYAQSIIRTTLRAADLTKQILAFARKGKYVSQAMNLHTVISEAILLLQHSIDPRIVIHQHLTAKPSHILGDATQIQNAILNLAFNARDAMPLGGDLTIATSVVELPGSTGLTDIPAGKCLRLQVIDTGHGMDAHTLHHLFEPFFTTKEPGKGTGLGLAAVYGTVRNHHGTITVTSTVGRGTTFDLYFPLLSTPVPLPPSSEPKIKTRSISERGHQILLIDDEAVVREVACKMLEGLGYQVTVCSDGVQALDLYRSDWKRFDLVLLDVVMPHISGREVFERLVAINPAVKVLVISGYSLAGDVQELLHQGASGFIQKPFQMAALDKAVQLALRGNPSQVDDSSSTFG